MALTDGQEEAILLTERIASVFSLVGCAIIMGTFIGSHRFRKPVNRLIFYASWGNMLANIATLMSTAGIVAGSSSALCQFQGFMIQMFVPADALWNLSMAINVYLTVFKNHNAAQLRAREPLYHATNYGLPFIVAFSYCFISTEGKGRIYGGATLWCWITSPYDYLRIATCYGPAWFAIIVSFAIYIMAGRDIWRKRQQLRAFSNSYGGGPDVDNVELGGSTQAGDNPFSSYKTTEIQITSELAEVGATHGNSSRPSLHTDPHDQNGNPNQYEQYSIHIASGQRASQLLSPAPQNQNFNNRVNNAAMEANTAALGYFKCCVLFFISLLVTWVPSSLNRVWSLIHPNETYFALSYAAGLVLPLMGFWNSVIYITTSWSACKSLWMYDIAPSLKLKTARKPDRWASRNVNRPRADEWPTSPRAMHTKGLQIPSDNESIPETLNTLPVGYQQRSSG